MAAAFANAQSEKAVSGPALFQDYTAAEFQKLERAQEQIDTQNFREELLSAAIFHETNRTRAEQGLSVLGFQPKVREASLKHSRQMAKGSYLSHGTPNQEKNTTPHERLVQQGLKPRFSAENVAFNFVLRYESGKAFYTREEDGRTAYSYEPGGEALDRHTYLSFAKAILTQWMNSPGHRKNIVATEAEFLGVGCALSRDEEGFDTVYATQNFFTPLPEELGNVQP